MQNLILIKLGGSTITDKKVRKKPNINTIRQLAKEIALARNANPKNLLVISHGQGSFAHFPAKEYQTKDGFINEDSAIGLAKVRQDCLELNLLVLQELIKSGIPAVAIEPFGSVTTKNKIPDQIFMQPFFNTLNKNVVPVVYGDVISDSKIGCTIFSGESILNLLSLKLKEHYNIKKIIEVGNTDGVYDKNGNTVLEINLNNFKQIKPVLLGSDGTDVTGGMLHKVQEAIKLSDKGITTLLISSAKGNLFNALTDQLVVGTSIH